jgi:hypothetical protein
LLHVYNSAATSRLIVGPNGTGAATPNALALEQDNTGYTVCHVRNLYDNGGLGELRLGGYGFTTFTSGSSQTERARIDSSGRLLVGTSTSNGYKVEIADTLQADANLNYSLAIRGDASGTTGNSSQIFLGGFNSTSRGVAIASRLTANGNAHEMLFKVSGPAAAPTERMRINDDGYLLIGYTASNGGYLLQVNSQIFATSATVATSDGRYKENVAPLGGCLDLVKALRPVSFTWKPQEDITRTDDDGNEVLVREGHNFPEGTQVGFIAQEVQEVLTDKPWLNSVIKENVRPAVLDDEGNELAPEEQFFGIAEGNLIAVLTNALQEAVAQIETLTDRVAALEAQ